MHDLRTLQLHKHRRAFCCLFAGLLVAFQVKAASVASDTAFARFMATTVSAGQETISFGSNGTPVLSPSTGTISTGGGNIKVTRTGALGLPGGAKLPITATAKISGATAGRIIKNALPLVGLAAAGPLGVALTSLAFELGYNLAFGSGEPVVTKSDPAVCSVAPCYEYHASRPTNVSYESTYYPSAQAAAQASIDYDNAHTNWWVYTLVSVGSGLSGTYSYTTKNKTTGAVSGPSTGYFESRSKAPSAPSYVPATQQDLADAIANKTGWPDSSAIAEALNQSQRATGEVIPTEAPKVTGPATVQGPAEVTKKPIPNGTRETTTQTDYNCTYIDGATVMDGGTVACTQKTTTTDKDTVTDPQTQQTTTTTTQTSETTKPADTTADKPLETKDPCDTNPDRVGCATLDIPEGEIPKTTKNITYQAEDLGFGGGSCPANVVQTLAGQQVTVIDWSKNCSFMVTYLKPVVFTIATFTALMLLFAGKVDA